MLKIAQKINTRLDRWFTKSEPNAAGRLGLFRVIYSLFYLWYLSEHHFFLLGKIPDSYYIHKILLIELLPQPLPPFFLTFIESALVTGIILLMFGVKARFATVIVLILGCFREAIYSSIDYEKGIVFLVFYIPLFMLINGRWGETYSLDSVLKNRKNNLDLVKNSDSSWDYFLVPRCILIILSALFLSSAIFKILGTWLSYSELIANFMLHQSIKATIYSLPSNSLVPFLSQQPLIYNSIRLFILVFEFCFFVSLFNRNTRNLFVAMALIFHATNALWFVVTFTPVLIVYLLYVDLQSIKEKVLPRENNWFNNIESNYLIIAAIAVAVTIGIFWNAHLGIRSIINLGGFLNWRTIWYPVFPLSIIWFVMSLINLFKVNRF
ncbi:MAG: hypothetical protein RH949_16890 [Coleofasciculus sp. A1-SPW-01]|uniref:hypothetical protein n=1 Tax=Coleofasciculus sp. A1-SPW-01 TaxID=3070819 RepID=UPI0032FBAE8D